MSASDVSRGVAGAGTKGTTGAGLAAADTCVATSAGANAGCVTARGCSISVEDGFTKRGSGTCTLRTKPQITTVSVSVRGPYSTIRWLLTQVPDRLPRSISLKPWPNC